ncbi:hypothetical protein K440DRAFT_614547 [Wilcoxina mikolae CBS 423.85]|nr:hypothetical protein K440DRAFT_614547 [Wilcoxina mikolae CBS 423.85]
MAEVSHHHHHFSVYKAGHSSHIELSNKLNSAKRQQTDEEEAYSDIEATLEGIVLTSGSAQCNRSREGGREEGKLISRCTAHHQKTLYRRQLALDPPRACGSNVPQSRD